MVRPTNHERKMNTYKVLYWRQLWNVFVFVIILAVNASIMQTFEYDGHISKKDSRMKLGNINITKDTVVEKFSETNNISKGEIDKLLTDYKMAKIKNSHMSYTDVVLNTGFIFLTVGWLEEKPASIGGKLFCILGSFIGILITFLMINTGAHIIIKGATYAVRVMHQSDYHKNTEIPMKTIKMALISFLGFCFIVYVLCSAICISAIFDLEYIDAVYLCIITYTTIGSKSLLHVDTPDFHAGVEHPVLFLFTLFGVINITAFIQSMFVKTHWNLRTDLITLVKVDRKMKHEKYLEILKYIESEHAPVYI